jgi:hypothetical protein
MESLFSTRRPTITSPNTSTSLVSCHDHLFLLYVEYERPKVPSSIGNGMHLVSKFLSSRLDGGVKKPLLEYLLALRYQY